jgi:hypothetical protein
VFRNALSFRGCAAAVESVLKKTLPVAMPLLYTP